MERIRTAGNPQKPGLIYENSHIHKQLLLKFYEVKLVNRILKIVDKKKKSKKKIFLALERQVGPEIIFKQCK